MGEVVFNLQRFVEQVSLSSGIDEYYNFDSDKIIYALGGNDYVYNGGDHVTIDAGAGNDTIFSKGKSAKIYGGAGNDSIYNNDENVTINGGAGNDSIYNYYGANVTINGGAGNDSIYNYYGANVTIDAGMGNDTIINRGGSYSKIDGGAGNDSIDNNGDKVTINGGAGNDTIINSGSYSKIDGGAGNDHIFNYGANVTIDAGMGNDTIINSGSYSKIDGGAGNDHIFNYDENVTINGGAGNDTLSGSSYTDVFQYQNGGGNDIITNYSGEDIVHITSGKIDSYSFDGGDLIFHVGDGSLRLKNMKNHAITVKNSSGKTSTKIYGGGYSPRQVIKNFVNSMADTVLDRKAKLDEAIQACSSFTSIQEAINKMVADCKKIGNADKFLRDYCGIILDNEDTGAITGWDAGGLKIKNEENVVPETLPAQTLTNYSETSFTKRNLTIQLAENESTLTSGTKRLLDYAYSWWIEESVKLIKDSYGLKFKDGDTVKLELTTDDVNYAGQASSGGGVTIASSASGIAENNFSSYTDRVFSHELTHIAQFYFTGSLPQFLMEGMADLTAGDEECNEEYFCGYLAGNADSLASYLNVDNYSTGEWYCYVAGYMFLRYLAKQASDSYDSLGSYTWKNNSVINGTKKAELLTSSGNYITLSGGAGADTLTVYGKKSKIYGGDGNDKILTGSTTKNLTINGGAGNDSIYNYYGANVTIDAGMGNDTIINSGSYSKIDGGAGKDTIDNKGTSIKVYGGASSDKIYNYGDKSTLKGEAGSDFIINGQYWESERGGQKVVIDGGESADTITSHGKNSVLKGGSGNDLIYNGYRYYESGNYFYAYDDENYNGSSSTISGGTGKDTVNNKGASTKIYGGKNNDKIYNYGDKSTLKGESGNDFIINGQYWESERGGQKVVIDGGAGVDTITSHGKNSVIKGGSGNDLIYNGYRYYEPWNAFYNSDDENYNGSNSTIVGGTGNDKISLSSSAANNIIRYASGDGKDTVVEFGSDDTLKITKGTYKTSVSGSDVVVKVGKGSVTLKDAVGKKISITDYKGKTTTKTYSSTSALLAEDNFATADNLSSIVKNNLPPMPDKIEMPTFDTLIQEKTLITYADK